jgi:hypothetical protein
MLKRHEIKVLLKAGRAQSEVATLAAVLYQVLSDRHLRKRPVVPSRRTSR